MKQQHNNPSNPSETMGSDRIQAITSQLWENVTQMSCESLVVRWLQHHGRRLEVTTIEKTITYTYA